MLDAASMALCRCVGFTDEQNASAIQSFREAWLECLELARQEMSR